ncbi:methyltransferase domain-containing protein [Hyphomicrobiales bacterium]|nr:methyltransferase domain-containing protein [Hyphomicrobiales bacterium]
MALEKESYELIQSLLSLKRYDQVIKEINLIFETDLATGEKIFLLVSAGTAYMGIGNLSKSEESFKEAVEISSGVPAVKIMLLNSYIMSKQLNKAIDFLDNLSSKELEDPQFFSMFAKVYEAIGDDDKAIFFNKKICEGKPYSDVHFQNYSLAKIYNRKNDHRNAFIHIGLAIREAKDNSYYILLLGQICSELTLKYENTPDYISAGLVSVVRQNLLTSAKMKILLSSFYKNFLEKNYLQGSEVLGFSKLQLLADQDLFIEYYKFNTLANASCELTFIKVRSFLLNSFSDKDTSPLNSEMLIKLLEVISQQAYLLEYIWDIAEDEKINLKKLKSYVEKLLKENKELDIGALMLLATFEKLSHNTKIAKLLENYYDLLSSSHPFFYDNQFKEEIELYEIRKRIKSVTEIKEITSKKVASFYEESPYPRWTEKLSKKVKSKIELTLDEVISYKIQSSLEIKNPFDEVNILAAGCGTGEGAFNAAYAIKKSHVVGLDLSLSSLSYALKRADNIDLNNVELFHGDILEVERLKKKFNHIVCTGVLHHMKDPNEGLKKLCSVLVDGGYMHLALYSRKGRLYLESFKKIILENNLTSSLGDIRKLRNTVYNQNRNSDGDKIIQNSLPHINDDSLLNILDINDFYQLSMLKDLLFHPQETLYTISDVKKLLKENNLEFLGFSFGGTRRMKNILSIYKDEYPNDIYHNNLDYWDDFETKYPRSFIGMYDFFVKKI